ncbi:MAG: tetratricopeptide repeat protein [Candidatus Doudnabacteria bacterium]|nr:tetratricopeptide repeat protein [Candidatus Doudnabacteria bacterium]
MSLLLSIVFAGSILSIIIILLSKLPAAFEAQSKVKVALNHGNFWTYLAGNLKILSGKIWHFILEAKDLKPPAKLRAPVEKVKKAFRIRIRSHEDEPEWLPEATDSLRDGQTAETMYLEAIKKDPQNMEAYENLGRLYLQEKNYIEAAEIFEYLTRFDPGKDTYFSNLALSLYSLQQYPQAAAAYEKALSLNNKIPARWVNLGLSFMAQGEYGKAIKAITNALGLDKRNLNYMMLLADLYLKAHNQIRAEQVLSQVLELEPTNRLAREKLMRLRV